jgi:hypothetical protein
MSIVAEELSLSPFEERRWEHWVKVLRNIGNLKIRSFGEEDKRSNFFQTTQYFRAEENNFVPNTGNFIRDIAFPHIK